MPFAEKSWDRRNNFESSNNHGLDSYAVIYSQLRSKKDKIDQNMTILQVAKIKIGVWSYLWKKGYGSKVDSSH